MNQEVKYDSLDRFWSKVEKTDICWIWTASKNNDGYGQFGIGNKNYRAHRIAFELLRGNIPEDKVIDHLCRNPSCVNPEHLEVVTNQENVKRGLAGKTINRYNPHKNKTHCPQGHEYYGDNLYLNKNKRVCKICKRESQIKWRYKQNESK